MHKKLQEQVIYPKDLLFAALYCWKTALVLGLVLAVLLGGLQLVNGISDDAADAAAQAAYNKAVAEYEAVKAPLEAYEDRCEEDIEKQAQYMQQSVLLSLDPYAHYRGIIRLYISTDYQIQPDKTYQTPNMSNYLLANYQAFLQSDNAVAALAETAGLEWRMMNEIYSVYYDTEIGVLAVHIRHNDQAVTEALLEQVYSMVTEHQSQLNEVIAEHEISVLYQDASLVVDTSFTSVIRESREHMDYLKEELRKVREELGALTPPAQPQLGNSAVKKAVILGALGFVAGFAVVAVCAWFGHMESDKIYSARLLSIRTGVKILGTVNVTKFNWLDRMIRKWEGRDNADSTEKAALLACDLRNRFPEGKLLLTGSGSKEERVQLLQAFRAAGVDAVDAGKLTKDKEAIEALKSVDGVVLAEKCGRGTCTGVFQQAQIVEDYEKVMLGCIVLNG